MFNVQCIHTLEIITHPFPIQFIHKGGHASAEFKLLMFLASTVSVIYNVVGDILLLVRMRAYLVKTVVGATLECIQIGGSYNVLLKIIPILYSFGEER